jgi:hypothetical protein
MMGNFTNFGKDLVASWLFDTAAVTRPTAWFVALHTGDPGATGASNEVLVATDADYIRKAVTFAAVSAGTGQCLSDGAVSWTVNGASAGYTVTWASIWDAATVGNCIIKGQLPVARVLAAGGVLTFAIGEVIGAIE